MSKQQNMNNNQKSRRKRVLPKQGSLARRVALIEKSIIETKYFDELFTFTPTSAGSANTLSNFAQGDTVMTRNGDKVYLELLELRYSITNNTVLVGPVKFRIMIIQDLSPSAQANSLSIAGSQVILGTTGVLDNSVITPDPTLMPHSFQMKYRYKVLYDKVHVINPYSLDNSSITSNLSATAAVSGTAVIDRTEYHTAMIPIHSLEVFQDGTANLNSVLRGSIVGLCFSDQAGNAPSIVMGTRLLFKDA